MNVLVTGGAGYIGSAVCWKLLEHGHKVVVLDDLRYGEEEAIPDVPLICYDISEPLDQRFVTELIRARKITAVCHLAAESEIPRCQADPLLAYRVNTTGGLMLLEAMRQAGVRKFVFSSTSSVYDPDQPMPLSEDSLLGPTQPYGASKLAFEQALPWIPDLQWIAFRYFNVCGATEHVVERPYHRSRLVPVAMDAARGRRGPMTLNGTDYAETPDHTCIRDFVHVDDIAQAHILALEKLDEHQGVFNLGIGRGCSNLEVIRTVYQVTGFPVPYTTGPRRDGDPPVLISDPTKAFRTLGWAPQYTSLEQMIESASRYEP